MVQLFVRKVFWFLLPLLLLGLILVGTFFIFDPFGVLTSREDYKGSLVAYNEDFLATERYVKKKDIYNAFIFGSSRAGCGFSVDSWKQYLPKESVPFLFAASNEGIFGIHGKIKLIDESQGKLDQVLILIDVDQTFKRVTNSSGHLYIKHPLVSKESNQRFVLEYLKDYVFSGFFVAYLDYKIFGTQRAYMNGYLDFSADTSLRHEPFSVMKREQAILKEGENYFLSRKNLFYDRPVKLENADKRIQSSAFAMLKEIKQLFDKHKTDYQIIIGPLYDQKKIHPEDKEALENIFGSQHVHDYSGKNRFTENYKNYYEPSHYRVHVGDSILAEVYASWVLR